MRYCPECAADVPADAAYCPTCGAALSTVLSDLKSGEAEESASAERESLFQELADTLTPNYELLEVLGEGGMGTVFLAKEPALKRLVAVKVVSPRHAADPQARARFLREARAAAAISHPNVVRVYSVGETVQRGLPYMIMQFVKGATLSGWLDERGRASEREARRIIGEVAAALGAAHQRGLVHRDIKPANVLIEAETGRAYVADFGIAAALGGEHTTDSVSLTKPGAILGTPKYMSPEQAAGEPVVPKSDLYSLGMFAYELLTGELPFEPGTAIGWIASHLHTTPSSVSDLRAGLSPDVARLVDRCLTKRPEDRPTAAEVARGMLPSLESEIEWPPPGLATLHRLARRLARVALITTGAGALVLLTLAFPPEAYRVDGPWWEQFQAVQEVGDSPLGVRAELPEQSRSWAAVLRHTWRAALILGVVAFCVGSIWLLARGGWSLRTLGRSRKLGWRWTTLQDVAADPDGRSGLLLAGAHEFAAIEEPRRAAILRARRTQARARLLAGGWGIAALCFWALIVVAGVARLDGSAPLVGAGVAFLVVLPVAALVVFGLWADVRERRLMKRVPWRQSYTGAVASGTSQPTAEEVSDWYSAIPGAGGPSAAPGPLPRIALVGTSSLASLLGALGLLALLLTATAVLVGVRTVEQWGPGTAQLVAELERISARDPLGTARRAWEPYLPALLVEESGTVEDWIRALAGRGRAGEPVPPYPDRAEPILHALDAGEVARLLKGERTLPSDTAAILQELAAHPRTRLFQRLARASQADLLGAVLERPPTEYGRLGSLPEPPYPELREAATANAWASVLAASEGEFDSAVVRLGENAAMAEQLLNEPLHFSNRFGALMLRDHALGPLASLEERRGDRERALELRAAADTVYRQVDARVSSERMAGLAGDPEQMDQILEALTNKSLLPGVRTEAFDGAWRGFCANPREILSGLSPARTAAAMTAARSMGDVRYARELATLTRSAWERRLNGADRPAAIPILSGVLTRLSICRTR